MKKRRTQPQDIAVGLAFVVIAALMIRGIVLVAAQATGRTSTFEPSQQTWKFTELNRPCGLLCRLFGEARDILYGSNRLGWC